tara:strand:- start:233 stop:493 length:261 start_codon:yes stop_codon:yes gene_type:complete
MEFLMYYASFATAGGVVSTWSLWRPAMNWIKENNPESMINRFKWLNGTFFFIISTICAPAMIACLAYEEQFIESFIKSLLKKDDKK